MFLPLSLTIRHRLSCVVFAILFGVMATGRAEAAPITLAPSATAIAPGATVTVSFGIADLLGTTLSAFDLDILFDPTFLTFTGGAFVDPVLTLNGLDLPESGALPFASGLADVGGGRLDVFGLSGNSSAVLEANQPDAFNFLMLNFISTGLSGAATVGVDLADPTRLFLDAAGNDLPVTGTFATTVDVGELAQVPEPSSLALVTLGAAGAALKHRRRMKTKS